MVGLENGGCVRHRDIPSPTMTNKQGLTVLIFNTLKFTQLLFMFFMVLVSALVFACLSNVASTFRFDYPTPQFLLVCLYGQDV